MQMHYGYDGEIMTLHNQKITDEDLCLHAKDFSHAPSRRKMEVKIELG